MGDPQMKPTYNPNVAVSQTAAMGVYVNLWDNPVEESEVIEKWRILDIKKYLFATKSREKALIVAERMVGIWTQYALLEMVEPVVYEKNGEIAWELNVGEGKCSMLEYLTNAIKLYFDAIEQVKNSKQKLNELEGKEKDIQIQSNSEYEAIVKESLSKMQSVFAKYHLREKITMLSKLTDAQYDKLCLELHTAAPSLLMALVYAIGLLEYIKRKDNSEYIFDSQAKMLKMLVDATGKSTPNTLGQELKTIIHQDTADLTKHTAWQYVEEAKKFIENL
jgi:hypothetical protein